MELSDVGGLSAERRPAVNDFKADASVLVSNAGHAELGDPPPIFGHEFRELATDQCNLITQSCR